ncbi:hypothetical protein SPFM17_00088 [Salmonella phage SPFM17]|nr:hypothetical protein SPFM4_00076 [Salmonella phage SPFM4]VFR12664.1 hypothetical protein SPFM11_00199 [Salmonella phage SPFM11]VFR12813.1 hypothetical protein SPFM13_00044 [Salmonella phage SPFM13]VFR14000.1 hypothetical protein SPFM17_00088 [Salmonella phage SPFM17]VFR14249.1 hypothetical protein SPFM16_00079 [Salmonella phage SPFM16]VFR14674.1 hypothetical protein SPFM19_00162 [Salmonella phage SPFM19]VFR15147.1 hypothetical protein SPFM22_00173 [Salmonella phage SPFM22]VFR15313.1 hypot
MQLQFRQRSVLLPFSAILGSFTKMLSVDFIAAEKEALLLAAVEEVLWEAFYVVPFRSCLNAPYVEGQFVSALSAAITKRKLNAMAHVKEITAQRGRIFATVRNVLIKEGFLADALGPEVPWEPGHPPRQFDHGYKLSIIMPRGKRDVSLGKWLQISWVRPTIDWQEMSVNRYLEHLAKTPAQFHRSTILPLHMLLKPSLSLAEARYLLSGEK